jgi:hypothetical protein
VTLTDPLGWKGYTYELVGTDPPPETSGTEPTFIFPNMVMPHMPHISSLDIFFLVAYRRRITHRETPVYLEARWHPGTGETNALVWPPPIPLKTAHTYGATALKLLQKVEGRGRRKGPAGFDDYQDFEDTLLLLIQEAHAKSMEPTQDRIATFLQPVLDRRRRDTGSPASVDISIESTKRLIRKHLSCPWPELVKKALQST